ncbi:MAG: aminotransferase class I/II-fold pyridoxal phosphate-dependent enzyme [Erysipelotrichia bacterium]|nr:aminotransferase class I/II-fold pyridoxal phosphate-dependent enzyme [Erysipelotrichia bacterium]NCC53957.1 aminotransferase class I/II-fold pyridoxal phosphate-dependent enzyme [Erysipelotrichia bacterium]
MENRLNKAVLDIEISGIRHFNQMASQIDGCIKFTIGEPNFETDASIKRALKKALDKNMTHYGENAGLFALRNKISDDLYLRYGVKYDEEEIIVTIGASEALSITLRTILNKGDSVIVFEPAYPAYRPLIEMYDAKYIGVDTCSHHFQIEQKQLEKAITEKTKAIILTSPNNPTGSVYNKESIQAVLKCIANRDIFVICDNIYDEIIYEDIPNFVTSQKERNKIIMLQSFSKSYAMAGFRLGYVCADKSIAKHLLKTHSYYVSAAPTFIQQAAISAFQTNNAKMVMQYRKRRDYACERLNAMGINIDAPAGAFYLFINIAQFNMSSYDFAYQLLHEYKVCVVPGCYFGKGCDAYIRLSYACSDADLKEGLDRIENFVNDLKSKPQ